MTSKTQKEWTPPAPLGVKETVAAKARKRRETHRALTEIRARAPTRRRNDLAPSLQYEMAPTDSLKPAARQVRRRDERQRARIESSIDRFGICKPILIAADRTIIEGHGIWEAAKARGIAHVPCVVVDHLDPNDLRLLRIALNRLGETGAWSVEALRLEFEELTVLGLDLLDTGFDMAEIDTLLLEDDDEGDGSELATSSLPGAFTTSRLGDVWSLGQHRLIRGDAREAAVYDRLLDGSELATLVLPTSRSTSPTSATSPATRAIASSRCRQISIPDLALISRTRPAFRLAGEFRRRTRENGGIRFADRDTPR